MDKWFELIRYAALVVGVTILISSAGIAAPLRRGVMRLSPFIGAALYCWICTGFWVGVALSAAGYYPFELTVRFLYEPEWLRSAIESGFVALALMWLASVSMGGFNPAWQLEQGTGSDDDETKETENG